MSIHRSLKTGGGLSKHRNVLSRVERLAKLQEAGKWSEDSGSVLGLPKVRNIKLRTQKKAKEKEGEAAAGAAAPGEAAPPSAT